MITLYVKIGKEFKPITDRSIRGPVLEKKLRAWKKARLVRAVLLLSGREADYSSHDFKIPKKYVSSCDLAEGTHRVITSRVGRVRR